MLVYIPTSYRWLPAIWRFMAAFSRAGTARNPRLAIAMLSVNTASNVRVRCRVRSPQALRFSVLTVTASYRR